MSAQGDWFGAYNTQCWDCIGDNTACLADYLGFEYNFSVVRVISTEIGI